MFCKDGQQGETKIVEDVGMAKMTLIEELGMIARESLVKTIKSEMVRTSPFLI